MTEDGQIRVPTAELVEELRAQRNAAMDAAASWKAACQALHREIESLKSHAKGKDGEKDKA